MGILLLSVDKNEPVQRRGSRSRLEKRQAAIRDSLILTLLAKRA